MTRALGAAIIFLTCATSLAQALDTSPRPLPLRAEDFPVAGLVEGMTSTDVRRVLGRPQSVTTEDDFRDPGAKLVSWKYNDIVVLLGSQNAVRGIWLKTPRVGTPRGLRVGDPASRVELLYGTPSFRDGAILEYAVSEEQSLHVIRILVKAGVVNQIFLGWLLD
jgi:hypothetical protein